VAVTVNTILLPDPPTITNTYKTSADNAPLEMGTPITTTLQASDPNTVTVTVGSTSLKVCETTVVTTTFVDQGNNPSPNKPVSLFLTTFNGDGSLTDTSGNTDPAGTFTTTLLATGAGVPGFVVTGWWTGHFLIQGDSPVIDISAQVVPTQLTLGVSPSPLPAGGSTGVVTATVRDCDDNLVSGQPVTITLSDAGLGWFSGPSASITGTTNADGVVTATLTSTSTQTVGTLTITGTSGSLQDVTTLDIASTVLTITKTANPADGNTVNSAGSITYTIRLTNTGAATATGVLLTDTLPSRSTMSA
jgi:adhesin/invasin